MKIYFKHDKGFMKDGRIYCEACCVADAETDDELLDDGWLPSMEEKKVWYQSRSCRLNMEQHKISTKRRNILNKLEIDIFDYQHDKSIDFFFKNYYEDKNYDIYDLYENCSEYFKVKILKITVDKEIIGYGRFTERENSNIFLNLSYNDNRPKLSIGTNLFFILSEYTKTQNKKYLYIYESYDNLFNYKQNFENVEIWDGKDWIIENGKS